MSDTRKPYRGTSRSLAIALDVGTTFSGVSYAILEPGEVPKIHGVTRFPGQEHVAGNSKIPSIIYYDREGKMMAAGAEAEGASVEAQAEDEGWTKAELFKLRLRPKTMKLQMNGMRLSPLPNKKTPVEVFGDFLGYLFRCTRSFIEDTHANGPALWRNVKHDIQFVLSHPNGWEGAQQTKMRRAAIYGGLIPDTDEGKARIRFVTEGEASLHACVLNGLAADVLSDPSGHGFIVADAGGGTLDISSYAIRGTSPLVIEEIAPPDCIFAGSVFVSRRARAFLEEKLKNSKYGTPDSLDHITRRFDETTKRLFRDKKDTQFIPFGSPLDKDLSVGIRGGQLKLSGEEVARLFEPSIEAAVQAIKSQMQASTGVVKSVWLVGGFAASPWLFGQLVERLAPLNVTVSRPDSQTSKAVADGAIGFYCDHHVSARMSKFMYGVEYLREFDPHDPDHVARQHRMCELPSGPKLLLDAFDCILARSVRVKESTVFSRKYCTELTSLSTLSVFEVEIWCYRGGDVVPKWILRDSDVFSTLCIVRADLSPLAGSAQPKQGKNGKTYWTIVFSIEIHFGLTEFKARIKWVDNGKTRYGPASIIYNESGHRADEDGSDNMEDDVATVLSRAPSASASPSASRESVASGTRSSRTTPPEAASANGAYLGVPRSTPSRGTLSRHTSHERQPSVSRAPSNLGQFEVESARPVQKVDSVGSEAARSMDKGKAKETPRSSRRSSQSTSASGGLSATLSAVWGAVTSSPVIAESPPKASPRPAEAAINTNLSRTISQSAEKTESPVLPPGSAARTAFFASLPGGFPSNEPHSTLFASAPHTPKDQGPIVTFSDVPTEPPKVEEMPPIAEASYEPPATASAARTPSIRSSKPPASVQRTPSADNTHLSPNVGKSPKPPASAQRTPTNDKKDFSPASGKSPKPPASAHRTPANEGGDLAASAASSPGQGGSASPWKKASTPKSTASPRAQEVQASATATSSPKPAAEVTPTRDENASDPAPPGALETSVSAPEPAAAAPTSAEVVAAESNVELGLTESVPLDSEAKKDALDNEFSSLLDTATGSSGLLDAVLGSSTEKKEEETSGGLLGGWGGGWGNKAKGGDAGGWGTGLGSWGSSGTGAATGGWGSGAAPAAAAPGGGTGGGWGTGTSGWGLGGWSSSNKAEESTITATPKPSDTVLPPEGGSANPEENKPVEEANAGGSTDVLAPSEDAKPAEPSASEEQPKPEGDAAPADGEAPAETSGLEVPSAPDLSRSTSATTETAATGEGGEEEEKEKDTGNTGGGAGKKGKKGKGGGGGGGKGKKGKK